MKNHAYPSIFYTITMSRLFALSQPIRAGEFSNSHALIPDWIVCVAGRFTPIHTSFEAGGVLCAVRTNLIGDPHSVTRVSANDSATRTSTTTK